MQRSHLISGDYLYFQLLSDATRCFDGVIRERWPVEITDARVRLEIPPCINLVLTLQGNLRRNLLWLPYEKFQT